MTIFLVFLGLLILLISGMPIFAALGLTATAVLLLTEGHVSSVTDTVFAHLDKPLLSTIPLFVFMAKILIKAKIIDDLFDFANTMIGHIKGGLGVATVAACTIFSAISGSSVATALAIGSTAIPQMKRFGYPDRASLGVIAAGGTLGILIPPSGPMILYAVVSEVSIGALFLAGIIPGLLLALAFSIYCVVQGQMMVGLDAQKRRSVGEMMAAAKRSIWAVMAPPLVMGGIYSGVFTASEAAAAGCFYALAVAVWVYRNFSWKDLYDSAYETMSMSLMVFMIIAGAAMFGHAITIIRLPNEVTELVVALGLGKLGFIIAAMLLIFVLGMFLEAVAIILVTTPVLLPTIISLGIDPLWYGILLMINLELAMITPPVGMNLFVIKGIANTTISEVVKGAAPFVAIMILSLGILIAFPQIATWLPRSAGFGL